MTSGCHCHLQRTGQSHVSVVNLGNSKKKAGCYQWIYLSEVRTKRTPRFGHQDEVESVHFSQQYEAVTWTIRCLWCVRSEKITQNTKLSWCCV